MAVTDKGSWVESPTRLDYSELQQSLGKYLALETTNTPPTVSSRNRSCTYRPNFREPLSDPGLRLNNLWGVEVPAGPTRPSVATPSSSPLLLPNPHPHRCGKSRKPPSQESYLMNWLMPSCWRFDRGGERGGEGEEIRKGFELQTSSKGRIMLNIWKKPLDRQFRVWVRTWRNKNPRALLVGMENGAALWKTAWVP